MIQQIIAIILLSLAVIMAMPYAQQGLQLLLGMHSWISEILTEVFSGGDTGNLIRQLITLLTIPLLAGIISSIIYWVGKRGWFPYFMQFVWVVWLIQTAALVIASKV